MIFNARENMYTLSSGRIFYANRGILGLGLEARGELSSGYDDAVIVDGRFAEVADTDDEARDLAAWTPAERAEVADEMIRRWTVFKERR
jgi:hypothetical protein